MTFTPGHPLMSEPAFGEGELAWHARLKLADCPYRNGRGKAWQEGYRYACALEAHNAEMQRLGEIKRREMESAP